MTNLADLILGIRKLAAAGTEQVALAHREYGLSISNRDDDGPRIERKPRSAPDFSDRALLLEIVPNIIEWERSSRRIAAGVALIKLREAYDEATKRTDFPSDEATWPAFVAKHFPFGVDRSNELMGRMLYRGEIMHCTKCGTQAVCMCGCGAPYRVPGTAKLTDPGKPIKPATALDRALAAIAEHPEMSNRAIAAEKGVSLDTVNRARRQVESDRSVDRSVDKRVGRDGRKRRLPKHDEDGGDYWEDPNSYRNAYLLRADQAGAFAFYEEGKVDDDILASAEYAMTAWKTLLEHLTERRKSHANKAHAAKTA